MNYASMPMTMIYQGEKWSTSLCATNAESGFAEFPLGYGGTGVSCGSAKSAGSLSRAKTGIRSMAKSKRETIDQPGPTSGQRLDTTELETMLLQVCEFEGADTAAVRDTAVKFSVRAGIPVKQAVTVALRVYRRLCDER